MVTRSNRRALNARRTRAAIRAAALTLTRERGYAAVTVDDVAALAGVSRRTVFNHFDSKADLLVVGPEPPEPEVVEAFVAGSGPLLEDLTTLLVCGAQPLESERGWLVGFEGIVRDNPEVERAVHERFRSFAFSLTDAVSRRLRVPVDDARVRAVVALTISIQYAAMDLWTGRDASGSPPSPEHPVGSAPTPERPVGLARTEDVAARAGAASAAALEQPAASEDAGGRPQVSLTLPGAIRAVSAAMGEVLTPPDRHGAA